MNPDQLAALDPGVPLLLLPVRLETRFRSATELLIRVYPDDVHLDSHEPGLTPPEIEAGERYWRATWAAGSTAERETAWATLTGRVGPTRAAWVSRALTPTNAPGPGADPVFPTPAQQASRWTRPPLAQALPDQWIALAHRGGARIAEAHGGPITRPLAAGLSPVDSAGTADPDMQWMVDFTAARNAGMGFVMDLTAVGPGPIDLLLVTGVRGSEPAAAGATELAGLLSAHRYTWGLDLVPPGTPTNNTPQARAAANPERPAGPAPAAPRAGSDAALLAAALGLDPAGPPFDSVTGRNLSGQRDAADMATALWPATWGYYLTQMMRPLFDDPDLLEQWRRWVLDTVRGRGPLPAVRVGDQPYGVLPVTSLDRLRPTPDRPELLVVRSVSDGARTTTSIAVLWDLDADGRWTEVTGPADVTLAADARATGLAALDLDGDGLLEIALGWLSADGRHAGLTVARPDAAGTLDALGDGSIPLDGTASAAAFTVAALSGGLAAVALAQIVPRSPRLPQRTVLRVGESLGPDGSVAGWLNPVAVDVPAGERLLGVAAADLDGDGFPELAVLTDAAGIVRYRVGAGLFGGARVPTWQPPVDVTTGGVESTAGGIVLADLDGDGAPEVLVHYSWDGGGGQAAGAYQIGHELDAQGRPGRWSDPANTGSSWPGRPVGGGVAPVALGRAAHVSWGDTTGRLNLLQHVRNIWRAAAAAVPRVGAGRDPDQTLIDLLGTDATSASVAVRQAIGPILAQSLWFAVNDPLAAGYETDLQQRLPPLLASLALPGEPRLGSLAYAPEVLDAPLPADAVAGDLREMADAPPPDLHARWTGPGVPLLTRLVRHSLLQAYADAAYRLVPVPAPPPTPPPEPELIDLADITSKDPATPSHTSTSWRHLNEATLQGRQVWEFLYKAAHTGQLPPEAQPLGEVITAVRRLAALPAEALQRLLMETLDLSTHRLDAWLTAVATQRLRDLRAARPTGVHLGGYGIITGLSPATAPKSTGYVHAPSIGHAATAAVLRNGYLTHGSAALAVDLSSTRVRLATELLDGVRAGQSLGALLGYRLERELTDRRLAQHLPALRQLAPEVAGQVTPAPASASIDDVASLPTIDGLALLRRWRDDAIPWGAQGLPAAGTPDETGLLAALTTVADAVDAVSDIGVAESVHQTLQGNHLRAGGSLDALARGELPPPEAEVLRSPRTGVAFTHRLLLLAGDPAATPALDYWTATDEQRADQVRAAAEPRLNAWAATVLGDPARVRFRVAFARHPDRELTLAEAGLCPLDVLYGPPPAAASLAETDLGRRLLNHAATSAPGPEQPVLVVDRADTWGPDVLTLVEFLTVAELAREFAAGARPAQAADLAPAGLPAATGVRDDDLESRAGAAADAFAATVTALRAPFALGPGTPAQLRQALGAADITDDLTSLLDLPAHVDIAAAGAVLDLPPADAADDIRAALTRLSAFGISGAAPSIADDLAEQSREAHREAAKRSAAADAADPAACIAALFGSEFRLLPLFRAGNAADLTAARKIRDDAGDAPAAAVEDWFEGVARVRAGARRLFDVRLIGAAAGGGPASRLSPLQLPARAGDTWVGGLLPSSLPGGLTGITVAGDWQPDADLAGLVVDEWVEVVPNATETTGLVFHFDAPAAAAPQAMLLAASPDPTRPWSLETLEAILLETVDATRIRAVQPQHVGGLGHLVPALLFARNAGGDPAGDTVATTFQH